MSATKTIKLMLPTAGKYGPVLGLLLVYAFFAFLAPRSFTSLRNVELILRQTTIVGIVALGMTPVIISKGIDLSVGSLVALVTVVVAWLLQNGASPLAALVCGLLTGLVCGALNGALIAKLRLPKFIATLATFLLFRNLAQGIAHEQKIDAPMSWLNEMLATLKPDEWWHIVPSGVWLFGILAITLGFFLRRTRLGLHVFAVGSSEDAARLSGIAVDRIKIMVYTLCGLLAGIAGVLQFSRLTVGDPSVANGLELDAITAVVIGGASLDGGRGGVAGTMVGALLMTVIRSGGVQMGIPNWFQGIITGLIILLAVSIDQMQKKK